jgi:allantoate deiminase
MIDIDTARSGVRIEEAIRMLSSAEYTRSNDAICRYAYTPEYAHTLDFFAGELDAVGFTTQLDAVGNLIARNVPEGAPAFGLGSHCDSNRRGGPYDGTLGVVAALEVARLNHELGLGLPLQVIAFLEEEASGFGHGLLGSRIMTQRVTEDELRHEIHAIDDGRSFWSHAEEAGFRPADWRTCAAALHGLIGWIELHIEQGRVLQDTGARLGIVSTISGIIQADISAAGRADHAGGTPMDMRQDPAVVIAAGVLRLERLAVDAGPGTVGTVGEIELAPDIVGVIPSEARGSVDVRSIDEATLDGVIRSLNEHVVDVARPRNVRVSYSQRLRSPPTPMAKEVVCALGDAATSSGAPTRHMYSGAGHDTMLLADRVQCGMLFVPCRDGISHSPAEYAEPADAALGVQVILNAVRHICHQHLAADRQPQP